ncbi:MAG: hypothetical protein AB7F41_16385 [Methylocystis sp.]|uniref:hypothetical protein n=1 Tax=Methylocystis sp. TaxID=1911079 RepID=UPI003D0ACB1A
MRRFTLLIFGALLAFAAPAQAERVARNPYDGDLQAYGGPWRYQHRDWSRPGHPHDPGVCYYWNDYVGQWEWGC